MKRTAIPTVKQIETALSVYGPGPIHYVPGTDGAGNAVYDAIGECTLANNPHIKEGTISDTSLWRLMEMAIDAGYVTKSYVRTGNKYGKRRVKYTWYVGGIPKPAPTPAPVPPTPQVTTFSPGGQPTELNARCIITILAPGKAGFTKEFQPGEWSYMGSLANPERVKLILHSADA